MKNIPFGSKKIAWRLAFLFVFIPMILCEMACQPPLSTCNTDKQTCPAGEICISYSKTMSGHPGIDTIADDTSKICFKKCTQQSDCSSSSDRKEKLFCIRTQSEGMACLPCNGVQKIEGGTEPEPEPEKCDGQDNDCDGIIDNEPGQPVGTYRLNCDGNQLCIQGACVVCPTFNKESEEKCGNGLDDDCDGIIDNGCPCGKTKQCPADLTCSSPNSETNEGKCGIHNPTPCDEKGTCSKTEDGMQQRCVDGKCRCDTSKFGQSVCLGNDKKTLKCVNLNTSREHCGSCGNRCYEGAECKNGKCSCNDPAHIPCDESKLCVDISNGALFKENRNGKEVEIVKHCGSCGAAPCEAPRKCSNLTCQCPKDPGNQNNTLYYCQDSNTCINLDTDNKNCGNCGVECNSPRKCKERQCLCPNDPNDPNNPNKPHYCPDDNTCVNLNSDNNNCGICGIKCTLGRTCKDRICQCPEDKPLFCRDQCVDYKKDTSNCGGCGIKCAKDKTCNDGECGCPGGLEECGNLCVNKTTNNFHCGGCNQPCLGGMICDNKKCSCPTGLTDCDGRCVDTKTDEANCGGCNNLCIGKNQKCLLNENKGTCTCVDNDAKPDDKKLICSGICVDKLNPAHCGVCGKVCDKAETRCYESAGSYDCGCPIPGHIICPKVNSNNECFDPKTDIRWCGSDSKCLGGKVCSGGQICESGSCKCPINTEPCGDSCVDTTNDDFHCGGCNIRCNKTDHQICFKKKCQCESGYTNCSQDPTTTVSCKKIQTDLQNCGKCGNVCQGVNAECKNGRCSDWLVGAAPNSFVDARHLAVDISGNIYVVGLFTGLLQIENQAISSSSSKNADVFIAKYNSEGKLIWLNQTRSTETAYNPNMVIRDDPTTKTTDIYIYGAFTGEIKINGGSIKASNNVQLRNAFILKLNQLGMLQWGTVIETAEATEGITVPGQHVKGLVGAIGKAIAVSGDGQSVFISGACKGKVNFVSAKNNTKLERTSRPGAETLFVAKMDSLGTFLSVALIEHENDAMIGTSLVVASSDEVFVSGRIDRINSSGKADSAFKWKISDSKTNVSAPNDKNGTILHDIYGLKDVFVSKIDFNVVNNPGVSLKIIGSTKENIKFLIMGIFDKNLYVAGSILDNDTLKIGSTTSLENKISKEMFFVTKMNLNHFSSSNLPIWAKQIDTGSQGDDIVDWAYRQTTGKIVALIKSAKVDPTKHPKGGLDDLLILEINSSTGDTSKPLYAGGPNQEYGRSIGITPDDYIVTFGIFQQAISIDTFSIVNFLPGPEDTGMFLWQTKGP